MVFEHFLITRFNIHTDFEDRKLPSEQWLQDRLSLFENYCLPSVKAQTCQQFMWLILMDESTPGSIRKRMHRYEQEYPPIKVLYVPFWIDVRAFYHQLISGYVSTGSMVLTTRLDNDDILASTHIEQVQAIASKSLSWPRVISFSHGAQLFLQEEVALGLNWKANHFVSLLEQMDDDAYTILGYKHLEIVKQLPIVCRWTDAPMWGEMVHGGNVINDYSPHTRPRVERWEQLPFPGEWKMFCRVGKNLKFLLYHDWQYKLRSIRVFLKRLF